MSSENTPSPATEEIIGNDQLIPREGWCALHLYYHIDHAQWSILSNEEKREAMTNLTEVIQEIRSEEDTQLLTMSIVSPKADFGVLLLCPGLHQLNAAEKRLTLALGAEVLQPVYSYLSMTERSEYITTAEQYGETLVNERNMDPNSEEYASEVATYEERMKHYLKHRLTPDLPTWPIVCFYNMNKRRVGNDNWYTLDFAARKELMQGHRRTGNEYRGRILQLITGSTGLDDAEWGVTLFAKDLLDVKSIVYEMRFDEVSSRYGEFGEFYIGIQLPLDQLFTRLGLRH